MMSGRRERNLVRTVTSEDDESRKGKLKQQFCFGGNCSKDDCDNLDISVCKASSIFTLEDQELGEVDLVEHKIEMRDHQSFRTPPR